MIQVELAASVREKFGKGAMHRLRSDGKTPAVLYGKGTEPIAVQLETKVFYKELLNIHRRNAVVTLTLDNGETHHALIKDVQADPVRDTLVHADFQKIDINKPQCFGVRVGFTGSAKGVDMGGMLMVEQHTVILEGVPLDIPDSCQLDVSDLEIGDKLLFDSLDLPDNVTMITDKDQVCVKVEVMSQEKDDEELEADSAETETGAEKTAEAETAAEADTTTEA